MYLGRPDSATKASHAEAERLRQLAARECFHSGDELFRAHLLRADPSGIPSARHVTNFVHSALKGEHSDVEPGGHQVVWLQAVGEKFGDSSHLGVDVLVADSDLASPLVLLQRLIQSELGQV